MKEKCPGCSEQSISTFYHLIAGSLQAIKCSRVNPFENALSAWACLPWQKLMHVTAWKSDLIQLIQIDSPFIPKPLLIFWDIWEQILDHH